MSVSHPFISVIVPCYNAEKYICEAIESVLAQTHTAFELIIVDDGSTDGTQHLVKAYGDERVRYIYQLNKGQCAACNRGIVEAKGDYIKFFDADDIVNPEHLSAQLAVLGDDPMAVASCAWARFYNSDPASALFKERDANQEEVPVNWLKHALSQRYDMMPAWLWLIPKTLLERAGGWDERLSLNNDFEFSIRLLLHASAVKHAQGAKLFYRSSNTQSLSSSRTEVTYQSAFLSAKLGCSYLLKQEDSIEMRRLCANKYLFWMYAIYPAYPALIKEMEAEVKKLGGGDRKIGGQSKLMHVLQRLVGWKIAKRIWLFARKMGYIHWGLPLKKKAQLLFLKRNKSNN
jgi:glycosyltransferase involved in cell wall biosynthesis